MCFDTDEEPDKPTGKNGKYGKVNILKVSYQLVARVEGTVDNIVKEKKENLVKELIAQ